MTLQIIKGDLFDPAHNFTALAQGVNCQGVMGAGIALPFKNKFPDMYEDYRDVCEKYGAMLGGGIHRHHSAYYIYNMFTQIYPGANATYELLDKAAYGLTQVAHIDHEHIVDSGNYDVDTFKVGLPWIGCGIGGLERHNVLHILGKHLTDSEVEFFIVEQE